AAWALGHFGRTTRCPGVTSSSRCNCLAPLPPVFPRKSADSPSAKCRVGAYEAEKPRFSAEKQGLDALNNYLAVEALEPRWVLSGMPPIATNDSYSAHQGTTLLVGSPGVLSNDNDPEHDPLTAVLVSGVSHCNLTLNSTGSFSYTPSAGYTGPDSFTY